MMRPATSSPAGGAQPLNLLQYTTNTKSPSNVCKTARTVPARRRYVWTRGNYVTECKHYTYGGILGDWRFAKGYFAHLKICLVRTLLILGLLCVCLSPLLADWLTDSV